MSEQHNGDEEIFYNVDDMNNYKSDSADRVMGIRFISASNKKFVAEMPITRSHTQPMGILHGGISVVLAESVGSIASNMVNTQPNTAFVGLEVNANHIKSGHVGDVVIAVATPVHIGKSSQVWNIEMKSKKYGYLICIARLTTHVMKLDTKKHEKSFLQYSQPQSATVAAKL